ncbi:protein eyes shut homolog [Gracilinanus agilis]|uniref:protein eyes shut homolog n=1 Tax=Gracilinanus agilis TaxID=191870 RepID=UPI001CFF2F8D|nr:protein eyes shut homolog [Gracilinanus agilis]
MSTKCEVNINECLSEPCLNDGICADGISYYTCHCKDGFIGTHCETNADACLSDPCLHGRCIDFIDGYECSCEAGWTSSRCEVNINDCVSAHCMNGGSCKDLVDGFVCVCPSGFIGKSCEEDIDVCEDPAMNLVYCLNGGICVDGPGPAFSCRCPEGLSGNFCEININECSSSPCLHGADCEDLVNGFNCKCQQGWSGLHCEEDIDECSSNPCFHGTCIQNPPGFGYTCFCPSGFVEGSCELNYNDCLIQTCSTGFLCVAGINNVTCIPASLQSSSSIYPETYGVPPAGPWGSGFSAVWPTQLESKMNTPQDSQKPDIFFRPKDVSQTHLIKVSLITSFEDNEPEGLTASGASTLDPLSFQFLKTGEHTSAMMNSVLKSVSQVSRQTSTEALDKDFLFSFITSSMTVSIFPTQVSSLKNHQTISLSATDMSSVISSIPGDEIELNSHSFLSHGFLLKTTSIYAPPISPSGTQEDTREYSAFSLASVGEFHWSSLSFSMTLDSPAKTIIPQQVAPSTLPVLHKTSEQTSLPDEYLVKSMASSINISLQPADSLSELSQTCVTCSMTKMKSSDECSVQALHSKQSQFYEPVWMNSAILSSWYTLTGTTTITSGHSFSSLTEITPSVELTELSPPFSFKRSLENFLGERTTSLSESTANNLNVYPCFSSLCSYIAPSLTSFLDSPFPEMTRKLYSTDQSISKQHYLTQLLKQDIQLPEVSHEPQSSHLTDSSIFEPSLQSNLDGTLKPFLEPIQQNDLKNQFILTEVLDKGSMTEVLKKHLMPNFSQMSYSVLFDQSKHKHTHLPKSSQISELASHAPSLTSVSTLQEIGSNSPDVSSMILPTAVQDEESPTGLNTSIPRLVTLPSLESIQPSDQLLPPDFSYVQYFGDSYLKYEGVLLPLQNNFSVEFQTFNSHGLLLFIKHDTISMKKFFIRLFIEGGTLKYHFLCDGDAEGKIINTTLRVDDGQKYSVFIRQAMEPCEAEMTLLGRSIRASKPSKVLSQKSLTETSIVFLGGFPFHSGKNQMPGPVSNFTGCMKVTEINNQRSFTPSNAVDKNHIDRCRSPVSTSLPTASFVSPSVIPERLDSLDPSYGLPTVPSVCQENLCHNGGTCHPIFPSTGVASFCCDCPLHFTGRFCEKDTVLFFPSFNGNSFLELPSPASLDETKTLTAENDRNKIVTIYLTVKTTTLNGTLLYTGEKNLGEPFLHLYLVEGMPTVELGCSSSRWILTLSANYSINKDVLLPITVRYMLPFGSTRGDCMIEMTVNGNPPLQKKDTKSHHSAQGNFGSIFLGHIPAKVKVHENMGQTYGYRGCIREFQVNNKELFIIDEALSGKNIENCNVPICNYHPCRNGGTCISDTENWLCECLQLFSGKLCQFATCENNPCGNGATCIPKSNRDAVCLCPYGRSGVLCTDGLNGDDFLAVGLRNGCLVYSYNLGSGTANLHSDPLNLSLGVHVVHLGRSFQTGWLKVDDQKNKSITSPGRLVGLNVFSQFYVGGYNEYTPELLPNESEFQNGFQGCIFDVQVRTRKDYHFRSLGDPEGHPNAGRSVGQCEVFPCSLIKCRNGGTCINGGSTVYCDCPTGWKGAFCTETVSVCDPEHEPQHQCSQGATCIPLPEGYACRCPLGMTGVHCEQALSISDPSFRSNESSWMSFAPFYIRQKMHIQLQFQPLSTDGILFYTAQHLNSRSGDFLCLSLTNGSVQLRYNLGDRTVILQSLQKIHTGRRFWHVIKAGRVGNEGYLELDGINVTKRATAGMRALDTSTDFYIGGVPSLSLVNPMAIENEPVGLNGCVREILINGRELKLTETGAKSGSNVGDCDGTPCGYGVCKNKGQCRAQGSNFSCKCLQHWMGKRCEESVNCKNNLCLHHSRCIPTQPASYICLCPLGWVGRYCENETSFIIAKFVGNSYIKYTDPNYEKRDLQFTTVSLNFSTTMTEGLILWMGKAEHEENDFLAIGIHNQTLKVMVNLGEKIAVPLLNSSAFLYYKQWHHVKVVQNQTYIKVYLDGVPILFEDIDPTKNYIALNYGGVSYLGGFEFGRGVNMVTGGLFNRDFIGKIKDVVFFQDPKKIELIKSEGYNIYNGDE